jgi:hypothetical protein
MLLVGGVDAKLSRASAAPTEQRLKADNTRRLKMPDLELGFFFIDGLPSCVGYLFLQRV